LFFQNGPSLENRVGEETMKVLHVFVNSIPILKGGSLRGKYIVDYQRMVGIEPVVLTSHNHPYQGRKVELIDGIPYYRTAPLDERVARLPVIGIYLGIWHLQKRVLEVAKQVKPDIIHSHSTFVCGFAGWYAARALGIPFIYEVRALNEDSDVALGLMRENSLKYKYLKWHDTWVMRKADGVTTICKGLMNDILARGIEKDKVYVIPNGVDIKRFKPLPKNEDLMAQLGIEKTSYVLGFAGAIRRLEGLDCLLHAIPMILKEFPNVKLLLVGDGSDRARLEQIVRKLRLQSIIIFTGEVKHTAVPQYYSLMDIVVIPRIDARVNHLVTPLKPLEALAMGKAVIISDVRGLKEALPCKSTRVVFKAGDEFDLADKCKMVLRNKALRAYLGETGRDWVVKSRDWKTLVREYRRVYQEVLRKTKYGENRSA